jgi:hypothetical protein
MEIDSLICFLGDCNRYLLIHEIELLRSLDHFVDLCGDGRVIKWDVVWIHLALYRKS